MKCIPGIQPIVNYEGAVGCSEAPGEQLGVQCLAHGHFDIETNGESGDGTDSLAIVVGPLSPRSCSSSM